MKAESNSCDVHMLRSTGLHPILVQVLVANPKTMFDDRLISESLKRRQESLKFTEGWDAERLCVTVIRLYSPHHA